MPEKFTIAKTIDFGKLNSNIVDFELKNKNSPYIFMSEDTIEEFNKLIGISFEYIHGLKPNYLCCKYTGRKVFCDNTLQFGEVELR